MNDVFADHFIASVVASGASRPVRRGGRTARLLARCPISRRVRHRSAPARSRAAEAPAGTDSGRDRLTIGILTLIAVGYAVALMSRIVTQYGL